MWEKLLKILIFLNVLFLVISCGNEVESVTKGQADIDYAMVLNSNKKISYVNEARPILEKRCVVCHGCYDAPCQLKLTSIEGIKRGANSKKVYNGERVFAEQPTRLFIDALTEKEWREKNFHSVLNNSVETSSENTAEDNLRNSILYKILRLKQLNPQPRVGMIDDSIDLSLDRKQSCPTNDNFQKYAEKFSHQGMPFAMPNLSDDEYHTLVKWISQGLPDDSKNILPESTRQQIKKWESFLNKPDLKHKLFSRYLYEHLVLGHLYFKNANNREFFRLVRSYTPPGIEVKEISSVRPFNSPGVNEFYYRFKYIKSSIVDKNHVVYELSDKRMARYNELFFSQKYQVTKLPSYHKIAAANPIKTFVDLPLKSRYKFLLDDSRFFIEGFIKGPVCRGQVALNVIEDHFWVFFIAPDKVRVNYDDAYLESIADDFNLPAGDEDVFNPFSIWTKYWHSQKHYMQSRQDDFKNIDKIDLETAMSFIWDGADSMDVNNRSLTIYRHFDSASVKQGMLGDYPESAWVIDYPILERIHYLLVAGYNVYGNVGHQFNTRVYMDFLRMESENNFLAFIPVEYRKKIQNSWYVGIRKDVKKYFDQPTNWLNTQVVNGFNTDDPQRELYKKLEIRMQASLDTFNYINRCSDDDCIKQNLSEIDKSMYRIDKIKGEILRVFPDVSFLKIIGKNEDSVYSLIRNKAYKNINFILDSVENRDRSSDTLSVYNGIIGSYPNFFFIVDESDIGVFVDDIIKIRNRKDYERLVSLYGVRRTASDFWEDADWFQQQYAKQDPIGYGILDLYRYSNR